MNKRKDGRWEDTVKLPNGKVKHFYGKTQSEVKRKMAAWTAEQERGHDFSEIADQWDADHAQQVTANAHGVYAAPLRRAKEFFGGSTMKDITASEVKAFVGYIVKQGYARRTVQLHRDMLNMIFDFYIAIPGSSVKHNPVSAVRMPKGLPSTRRLPPTDEQLESLPAEVESDMALFARFLLYTGLRRGELLALRWEDIDMDERLIHVRREVTYESNTPVVVDRAKTPAGIRDVDLLEPLAAVLLKSGKGYIFGGDKPLTKTRFRKAWGAFCVEIGQGEVIYREAKRADGTVTRHKDYKPLMTPHQFRHAYASMLDDAGIDESAAKVMLGHKQISTTKDIYTHLRQSKRERAASTLNDYLAARKK